jgi:hypothetical protein
VSTPVEITDPMSAANVWLLIGDILESVELAAGEDARNEVRDYIINHYGD